MQLPDLKGVRIASENLKDVSIVTPLTLNERLSEEFNSRIFLKREDLQKVRSSKFEEHLIKLNQLILIIQKTKELFVQALVTMLKGLLFLVIS